MTVVASMRTSMRTTVLTVLPSTTLPQGSQLLQFRSFLAPPLLPVPPFDLLQINLLPLLPLVKLLVTLALPPRIKVRPWLMLSFHPLPHHHVQTRLALQRIKQHSHAMPSMGSDHLRQMICRSVLFAVVVVVVCEFAELVEAVDQVLAVVHGKVFVRSVAKGLGHADGVLGIFAHLHDVGLGDDKDRGVGDLLPGIVDCGRRVVFINAVGGVEEACVIYNMLEGEVEAI